MAKVNMMQLREDPPTKTGRLYWGVRVDGVELYVTIPLAHNEEICPACEGTGRDQTYEMRCQECNGEGTVFTTTEEEE